MKHVIIDYLINKVASNDTIMFIGLPFALPVILCFKNNNKCAYDLEAWGFAICYRKVNTIMQ